MTVLALVPRDTSVIDLAADRAAQVVIYLESARDALQGALDLDAALEIKTNIDMLRTYTLHRELGKEAELLAAEMVRRAERRIGQLVKEGKAEGTIAKQGDITPSSPTGEHGAKPSAVDIIGVSNKGRSEHYAMADATDEAFDAAIDEAKAEGNVSRANVVRKVKGDPPAKRKGAYQGRVMHTPFNDSLERMTFGLAGYEMVLRTTEPENVDADKVKALIASYRALGVQIRKVAAHVPSL